MLFLPPYLVVGQLLHLDDVVQVEVHQRRDQVAGIIICSYMYVDDEYSKECQDGGGKDEKILKESFLHIGKFLYACRWCKAVKKLNYLRMLMLIMIGG